MEYLVQYTKKWVNLVKIRLVRKRNLIYTVDLASIPVEDKGGAIIFSRDENGVIRFAMVHDVFGYWTLSKGGMELGENPEEGTVREIKEEIGLDITIIEKLGENEYVAHHPEKGKIENMFTISLQKVHINH
jgi:8-oxo-dGTP pyrophosphatase MutT (NUDIX family)